MERSGYNSDVSDKQWERLQEYLPELSTRAAHLRKWELRVIINAILYVVTTGFQVLPKRWIVERTFSWFGWYRRLNIDYERKTKNSENMIYVAMICLMLKRIK